MGKPTVMICLATLSLAVLGGMHPPSAKASSAKGWEEQAWRAGFLASHTRFMMIADLEDDQGQKTRIMTMRGFTDMPLDGVFMAPVDEEGNATGEGFRGYVQTARESRVLVGEEAMQMPSEDFSSQHWWMKQGPATSFAQWWSMVLAVPQQPRSGGCRFSSHPVEDKKQKVWLPRACKTTDPVTGRPLELAWSAWRAVSDTDEEWQLWLPQKATVKVEGRSYEIELKNLQLRTAYGPNPLWPMTVLPQAFPGLQSKASDVDEMLVPIEDLDYHEWKAD